jgi:hypothetical protein
MLLFCGLFCRTRIMFENVISFGGLLMSGQVCYLMLRMYPVKWYLGQHVLSPGNGPYIYNYQVQVLIK